MLGNGIPKRQEIGRQELVALGGSNPAAAPTAMATSATTTTGAPKQRKKDRWGPGFADNKIAQSLKRPVAINGVLTPEQLDVYALNYRIDEITERLKRNEVVPPERERSPSPPPQYDQNGRRINTREIRYRTKLETERVALVDRAIRSIPGYKPPSDFNRPQRNQEKIYIPVNDYPEINFIGLLLGPRGKTLKQMEEESGARIAIRGKGSVKEGKGRTDIPFQSSMEEDLHCVITADNEDKVQRAVELVNKVIETAASTPEAQNELKRGQLRELAALNGTLRDDESQPCPNCGELGHRKYDCPQRKNFTASVVCRICGHQGHFARDCKERRKESSAGGASGAAAGGPIGAIASSSSSSVAPLNAAERSATDREYEQLMQELNPNANLNALPAAASSLPQAPSNGHISSLPAIPGNSAAPGAHHQPRPDAPWKGPVTTNRKNTNQTNYRDPAIGSFNGYRGGYSTTSSTATPGTIGAIGAPPNYNNVNQNTLSNSLFYQYSPPNSAQGGGSNNGSAAVGTNINGNGNGNGVIHSNSPSPHNSPHPAPIGTPRSATPPTTVGNMVSSMLPPGPPPPLGSMPPPSKPSIMASMGTRNYGRAPGAPPGLNVAPPGLSLPPGLKGIRGSAGAHQPPPPPPPGVAPGSSAPLPPPPPPPSSLN